MNAKVESAFLRCRGGRNPTVTTNAHLLKLAIFAVISEEPHTEAMKTTNLFLFAVCLLATSIKLCGQITTNPLPEVSIRAGTTAISESGTNWIAVARVTTNLTSSLIVYYSISGGASNGVDYVELPGHITIPAGLHNIRIPLVAIDDAIAEPTESIVLTLRASEDYRINSEHYKATVFILDNDNIVPTVHLFSPTNNSVFFGPTNILLKAEARDSDGWLRRVEFYRNNVLIGSVTNQNTALYQLTWFNAQPGSYSLTAKAVDNFEAKGISSPVNIVIHQSTTPTNIPPSVQIVAPTNYANYKTPADIMISAQATDTDGFIKTVEFLAGTNTLAVITNQATSASNSNLFHFIWHNAPAGEHALRVKATDNGGAVKPSEPVFVKVTLTVAPPPPQPIVTIVATDPEASEGATITTALNTATFTVSRRENTNVAITVYYKISGTASNGVDYVWIPNLITIPAGKVSADIVIRPIDDKLVEGDETVFITLQPPACIAIYPPPPECYIVGEPSHAGAVIIDNDFVTNNAFVHRKLPLWYVPGVKVRVHLRAEPRTNTVHYIVHDTPPAGWTIQAGEHGTVNSGRITFGPFNDAHPRTFVYEVIPLGSGEKSFVGEAVANGISTPIIGATAIVSAPPHPADTDPAKWTFSAKEVDLYTTAWKHCERWPIAPNPIPVNFVTRAGFLFAKGGSYTLSTHYPTPIPPMLWVSPSIETTSLFGHEEPWATNHLASAVASLPTNYVVGVPFDVSIAVTLAASVKAYALEEVPPIGFAVTNVSDGGVFCRETRKIRWGVFSDKDPRTLSYQLLAFTNSPNIAKFAGVISCNGINQRITGQRETRRATTITSATLHGIKTLSDGNRLLTFSGEAGVNYVLEETTDLVDWKPIAELLNSDGTLQYIDLSTNEVNKFYRAVPRD